MNSALDDMYRDIILDHYKAPRGKKPLTKIDISTEGMNPSCGDEITIEADVAEGIVRDVHVNCKGCAISVASGSMLAESVKGMRLVEVEALSKKVKSMLTSDSSATFEREQEDLASLQGVRNFPVRVKCALLAWMTLLEGIKNYSTGKGLEKTLVSTEDN